MFSKKALFTRNKIIIFLTILLEEEFFYILEYHNLFKDIVATFSRSVYFCFF